jgi:hypothetical protein
MRRSIASALPAVDLRPLEPVVVDTGPQITRHRTTPSIPALGSFIPAHKRYGLNQSVRRNFRLVHAWRGVDEVLCDERRSQAQVA